jgi:hypothetical protein
MDAVRSSDRAAGKRAMDAMMEMKKIDIATIEAAVKGWPGLFVIIVLTFNVFNQSPWATVAAADRYIAFAFRIATRTGDRNAAP